MWGVMASVYGDVHRSRVDLDAMERHAGALNRTALRLGALADTYAAALIQIEALSRSVPFCRDFSMGTHSLNGHSSFDHRHLIHVCIAQQRSAKALASRCSVLAGLLWRARALYSDAESSTMALINRAVRGSMALMPVSTAAGALSLASMGAAYGVAKEGRFNIAYALGSTAWAHEGLVAGLSQRIAVMPAFPILQGAPRDDEANQAAGRLASPAGFIGRLVQGSSLHVSRIQSQAPALPAARSIDDALHNLDALGLAKSTVAVQRYHDDAGADSWVVTIPGTQPYADSPLGWAQNVELMSDDGDVRMRAASARFVLEAMSEAGIRPGDQVALVGHSQGGIIAASLAAQSGTAYRISHIITAGSPIANHPVPASTWVTSMEIDDELVSSLDGASNPPRRSWLTIRGTVTSAPASNGAGRYLSAPVSGSGSARELPHGMNYQRAAWQSAQDLGSADAQEHDAHFSRIVSGGLQESLYYEGRMST
ncbi:MAG: esterase/lipase family protein [Bifidobacterium psychraerophilum]